MQPTVIDDRYTLGRLLGSGGMAQVYMAHDEVLGRDVAIKLLRGPYAEDEEFVERFRREARSVASLSHPNIVSVYDQGRSEDGAYYMAMEYVPGGTLKDRIRRDGALAPNAAAGVALQIADALQAAHEKGVIHRDIKPHNVLVTSSGDVKVTDFGIARAASATSTVTTTGAVLGTAGYMSPEQAKGEPVGPPSDLYSLGAVLYEMLTGNLPYEAESDIALAVRHVNEPPPSPREANPEVPEALDTLTRKLLAKNPRDRYPSAAALANDLERVRSGLPVTGAGTEKAEATTEVMTTPLLTRPEGRTRRTSVQPPAAAPAGAPEPGGRRRRGRLFPILATLLFAAVVIGGLIWALTRGFDTPGNPKGGSGKDTTTPSVQSPSVSSAPPPTQPAQPQPAQPQPGPQAPPAQPQPAPAPSSPGGGTPSSSPGSVQQPAPQQPVQPAPPKTLPNKGATTPNKGERTRETEQLAKLAVRSGRHTTRRLV